ncbi:unnamed protein product [Amoebophrya sp. A25]|nr:unnamed protein product [Amoebophrya sp. A25]|eukprot:GSA25T00010268001.1
MAIAKNKGLAKGGKKGQKKKQADPFLKKVWYDIKAPTYFNCKGNKVGRTCVTKTQGNKIETEGLKGRICEFNMADIQDGSEDGFKKIKLEIQEIQGKNCLTDFHGLGITRDKMCQMIKKKHSLIDAVADCKTADGYVVRIFVIGFTKDVKDHQVKVFTYAQTAQIKAIRKKMVATVQQIVGAGQLKDLVKFLIMDKIETDIKSATNRVYPLDPVHIHKVKIIKKPKLDITKLMEVHDMSGAADEGAPVDPTEPEEAKNLLTA